MENKDIVLLTFRLEEDEDSHKEDRDAQINRILLDCHYSSLNEAKATQASNKELGPSFHPTPTAVCSPHNDCKGVCCTHICLFPRMCGEKSILFKLLKQEA